MVGFLSKAARRIPEKPKGILLVSAHWEVGAAVLSALGGDVAATAAAAAAAAVIP
jgi:hypothetical protein